MPAEIHVGATLSRLPGPKYTGVLGFAELAPTAPLPRAATLAKWRRDAPAALTTALVAPRAAVVSRDGPLRFDDEMEGAITWLVEAADAVRARAVVVATGPDLTTGQRDRDRLARWLDRIPRPDGRLLVWNPAGLWDPTKALRFADKMRVTCALDPLEQTPLAADAVYCRIKGMGGRTRISEGMLLRVHEALADAANVEGFVAIESERSFKEAQRLRALFESPEA